MDIGRAVKGPWVVRAAVAAILGSALVAPVHLLAAEQEDTDELAEVQVTGTRIQVPGNYSAANPVTSVTAEDMRRLGIVNVADALTSLVPQNLSTYQPTMVGDEFSGRGSFFIGNTIANLRGLDPTFGSRTLTMIDGRRVVSTSNQADVVDMNIIPSNLLQRMDVVTGGASATYGSGAMAGVVNLVLNNRLKGFNVDMDYGLNEAGDGGNKHVAVSGGTALFGGRGHALIGLEWQEQDAIRDCAAARSWCAESRSLFTNATDFGLAPGQPFTPTPGFDDGSYPARFQIGNVRFGQFQPTGSILSTNVNNTSGLRFTADGTGVEPFQFGFRGGSGANAVMGGDGPLQTSGTTMTPSNDRKTAFTNFEFDFNERTTGYLQASFAKTEALNKNTYTQGAACVRFNTPGVAARPGASLSPGTTVAYNFSAPNPVFTDPNFLALLGWPANQSYFFPGAPPPIQNATAVWTQAGPIFGPSFNGWVFLSSVTLNTSYQAAEIPAVLPTTGDQTGAGAASNANAFLRDLSPEALLALQTAFNNSPSTGPGPAYLYSNNPCAGFTAVQKVWNPQIQQNTAQQSETMRAVVGVKGRFGNTWRWDGYFQHGETESESVQNNVWTTIRLGFAMDSVIDNRAGSPTRGQPVCRVTRDGAPTTDLEGLPLSDPAGLAALAEGCVPLNIFGSTFADSIDAERQANALNYAFQENGSSGDNSLDTLAFNASGTLWNGFGAGPMTGAFGLEFRRDKVSNAGSEGAPYERADYAFGWADAFGGTTRVGEVYSELNLPLVSGLPGLNLWSINGAVRYAKYKNKGGAGTTGESVTQSTTNWKFSTTFEPFDWMRFRLTRSRDLRAAGYRDLFINQPSVPDASNGTNYWLPYNQNSTAQRQERWGTTTVGNPDLKPERSDTLTLGLVLSPGGWAQGMRFSADYYAIKVTGGINAPFGGANPLQACWEASGNRDPVYLTGVDPVTGLPIQVPDPTRPAINGQFDESNDFCGQITFDTNPDGSRDLTNVISYNTGFPVNSDPFQRRGIDLSWNYLFPVNRVFDTLPGSVSLTVRATRALEASGVCRGFATFFGTCFDGQVIDSVGQIRNAAFIPGVQATPKWTGNVITTYLVGDFTMSLSAKYVGGAVLDKMWGDSPDDANYQNELGQYLFGSVDNNYVKPYVNFALNGSYDLRIAGTKQFQVFGSVNNLFDKDPPYSGGYVSGASPQYHDIMGRAYRMGVRLRF